MSAQCCEAGDAELGMCARRKTGCIVPAASAEIGSPPVTPPDVWDVPAVHCDPLRDEVVTSWRYTSEGCDGDDHKALYPGGSLQIEVTCCSMSTKPWELISGTGSTADATETALHGDVAQMLDSYAGAEDVPAEFAVDLDSPGPLFDTMLVQEGASYTSAEDVAKGDWDAVMAAIEPAAADINGARFCKTDADGTSDLREAFEPCPPAAAASDPTSGSALPAGMLKPEKGAAFVGCYLGFIPSDASQPTDVGFYERIALGRVPHCLLVVSPCTLAALEHHGHTHWYTMSKQSG